MAERTSKVPVERERTQRGGALQGWTGWNPFDSMQREIDRVFEDFGRGWGLPSPRRLFEGRPAADVAAWTMPAVDVAERDNAYEISAELPGLDEKHVEISLSGGVLTIRGEKSEEAEDRRKDYRIAERRYGSFQRSFTLPSDADTDKIEATFKNGVLKVTLPKRPEAQKEAKKIEVKAS